MRSAASSTKSDGTPSGGGRPDLHWSDSDDLASIGEHSGSGRSTGRPLSGGRAPSQSVDLGGGGGGGGFFSGRSRRNTASAATSHGDSVSSPGGSSALTPSGARSTPKRRSSLSSALRGSLSVGRDPNSAATPGSRGSRGSLGSGSSSRRESAETAGGRWQAQASTPPTLASIESQGHLGTPPASADAAHGKRKFSLRLFKGSSTPGMASPRSAAPSPFTKRPSFEESLTEHSAPP